MKLTDLRPCDQCDGAVGLNFQVIRFSLALVKPQAVNEFMGMHQFFGGRASNALVENFAPSAADAVTIAMDVAEFKPLMTELFICHGCFMRGALDLPVLAEKRGAAIKNREAREAAASAERASGQSIGGER